MIKLAKILLPLAWMGFIYVLSDLPGDSFFKSINSTQGVFAHIFLYSVLSYLIIISFLSWRPNWKLYKIILAALFISIFYGITDEYHQGYVLGRFVSFTDLAFDSVGAIIGAAFWKYVATSNSNTNNNNKKPKLLLHICCASCGSYVSRLLQRNFHVALYFYNPNIFPKTEYKKRLKEVKMIAKKYNLDLFKAKYDHNKWLKLVKNHKNDPERGVRCRICYKNRLKNTAKIAQAKKFDYFTTTLTVSPHKDAQVISKIGCSLADKYNVQFLDKDFKKQDGFKKSIELSKELRLYRQNYCGCEYSYINKND